MIVTSTTPATAPMAVCTSAEASCVLFVVGAAAVVDGDDVDAFEELALRAATAASGTAAMPTEASVMSRRLPEAIGAELKERRKRSFFRVEREV